MSKTNRPKEQTKRVCLVSWDLLGPVKNGGIGTATFGLAEALADAGHQVTICFLPTEASQLDDFTAWQDFYCQRGIALLLIPSPEILIEALPGAKASYAVYLFLKEKIKKYSWDIVHFPDMQGLGYYSVKAKKNLGFFNETVLSTISHGLSSWHNEFNFEQKFSVSDLELQFLEKESLKNSDVVFAPTEFALKCATAHAGSLPAAQYTQPNIVPEQNIIPYQGNLTNFNEIVFFGRLETRKGLKLFTDTICELGADFLRDKKIIFLGKNGKVGGSTGLDFIQSALSAKAIHYEVYTDYDSKSALKYLNSINPLVIIPSLSETMGYTLCECMESGLPFLASRIPAFQELVAESCHQDVFFDETTEALAQKIKQTLSSGFKPVKSTKSNYQIKKNWVSWHNTVCASDYIVPQPKEVPLVSVCIAHRNRPHFLKACLESLKKQTYQNLEILIGDDGSDSPAALSYLRSFESASDSKSANLSRPIQVQYFSEQLGPGAVRNRIAEVAQGEILFFMDDDNRAHATEIEMLVAAMLRSSADIVTCPFEREINSQITGRWLPLGQATALAYFYNVLGDMNSLVKKSAFFKAGQLNESMNFRGEDWEFFLRASFAGLKLEVVPEALMIYREHEGNYSKRTNNKKSRNIFLKSFARSADPEILAEVFKVLDSLNFEPQPRYMPETKANLKASYLVDPISKKNQFPNLIYKLNKAEFNDECTVNEQIQTEILPEGVAFHVNGDDPIVLLPEKSMPELKRLRIDVRISAARDSVFKVYYKTKAKPYYTEEQIGVKNIYEGENCFHLELENNITGAIRIDPAVIPGVFVLNLLEINSEI